MPVMPNLLRYALFVAALCMGLSACTTTAPRAASGPAPVWPQGSAAPRIAFVQSINSAADLGIQRAMLSRIADWLFGEEETRLVRPMAVLKLADALYVADPGVNGVHRFDSKRGSYEVIRAAGDTVLPSPVALASSGDGSVYIADSRLGKLLRVSPGSSVAIPLALDVPVGQPTGLAFDATTQRIYVTDTLAHCVLVYSTDGRLLSRIGERGTGPGQFNFPTLLWLGPDRRLYVTDTLNFRVQVLDAEGKFITTFGRQGDSSGDAARPKGVATDSEGHIYVVDGAFHAFQIFDTAGRYLLGVGERGSDPGEFWLPAGIAIDAHDRIYIADSYNRRVQVFQYLTGGLR